MRRVFLFSSIFILLFSNFQFNYKDTYSNLIYNSELSKNTHHENKFLLSNNNLKSKNINYISGEWIVTDDIISTFMSSENKEDSLRYSGKYLNINNRLFNYNNKIYKDISYDIYDISEEEFFSQWRVSLKSLGIYAPKAKKITIKNTPFSNEFNYILVKNRSTIYLIYNGTFFRLNKVN